MNKGYTSSYLLKDIHMMVFSSLRYSSVNNLHPLLVMGNNDGVNEEDIKQNVYIM
jgi:hypothetical protein